jgi:peptidyl-prolyl cis-trans isomerase C
MIRTRYFWSATAVLALSSLPAPAQPTPPTPTGTAAPPAPTAKAAPPTRPATDVAATVNGQPILEGAVQRGLNRYPPERWAEARAELLNYLIDNALLDQYVMQFQIKVEKAEVDKKIEDIKAEIKKTQKKEFDKFLADMKLTEAELREHVTADLRWEKFATNQATDKVLLDLFNSNKEMFDGSMMRARHILLAPGDDPRAAAAAMEQLQTVKKQIEAAVAAGLAKLPADADAAAREKERVRLTDEAFAAKAKEISVCPSKAQGGDLEEWFGRVGIMVEPFSRAAFALKPYQISDVVKTQFGYHLILATERKPGKEVKFEAVKEEVKEVYYDKLREAIVAQVRPKAKIEITPVKP